MCIITTDKREYQHISNEYPQHMFLWRNEKNIRTFQFRKRPYLELWYVQNAQI